VHFPGGQLPPQRLGVAGDESFSAPGAGGD